MDALVGASGLWILKPARGSQGEGIKLLNQSDLLEMRSLFTVRFQGAPAVTLQPWGPPQARRRPAPPPLINRPS